MMFEEVNELLPESVALEEVLAGQVMVACSIKVYWGIGRALSKIFSG